MGFYIETRSGFHGKAKWIVDNLYGIHISGRPTPEQVTDGYVPVCVVDNGEFEAAAIAFNPKEAEVFDDPEDTRPKQWLLIPLDAAVMANRAVEAHINWKSNVTNTTE